MNKKAFMLALAVFVFGSAFVSIAQHDYSWAGLGFMLAALAVYAGLREVDERG